jgi:hypothetical protein
MKKYFILFCAALITLAANTQSSPEQKQTTFTPEQFAKKWHFKNRENADKSPGETGKGTYLDLKKNGEYEALIVKPELVGEMLIVDSRVFGTWTLNEKKQTLTLVSGKEVVVWKIKSITDTELVLVNKKNKAVWTFSDKE